jgi:hypothetical protein
MRLKNPRGRPHFAGLAGEPNPDESGLMEDSQVCSRAPDKRKLPGLVNI